MEPELKWYEFAVQYWAQITVLLGAVGFVIKILVDWAIKKREINFVSLQGSRLEAYRPFFRLCSELENSIQFFASFLMKKSRLQPKDESKYKSRYKAIINEIDKKIVELYYSIQMISLQANDREIKLLNDIQDSFVQTYSIVRQIEDYDPQEGKSKRKEILKLYSSDINETHELQEDLMRSFRQSYGLIRKPNRLKRLLIYIKGKSTRKSALK